MTNFKKGTYTGERALFATKDATFEDCIFEDGESPLKESSDLKICRTTFRWKYPLWYCTNVMCENCTIEETARSGIWYTKNLKMNNCFIYSPKTFRRAKNIVLENCYLPNAKETFWNCHNYKLFNCNVVGDYLGLDSSDVEIDMMNLDGNYAFDGAKNIVIRNSTLKTKDAFWNSENVTIINSTIIGEYFGWNSKNVTLINSTIESHQGLCYMDHIKLIKCKLINTDLCFEYCSNIDADIISDVDSIKNPYSGTIKAKSVKELILDEKFIDPHMTRIIIEDNE